MTNPLLPGDIIPRLRARDESAYKAVVEAYFTPLARFAYRIVGSYDVAEDIVQGVLVKISELGPEFNPGGSLAAYLYTAVRNRSLNAVRDEQRENVIQEELADESAVYQNTAVIESSGDMARVMSLLTGRQRTVMRLRYLQNLTIPEIAEILGISVTSTNRLISRALEVLRENYRKQPEG